MKIRFGWILMTILSILIILVTSRYFTLNPEVYFSEQREVYRANQLGILTHITGGVLALGL